ncbi:unnamed protein product [Psylliodes chrysocephalus]|uniref:MSP domain-containing protein n=1 Tax=Psylliodes chrysocephalus TaxID=3402493 RepID=A0A9P0D706_9CUCU|nr:unnamed protein product [Psylliodes chrysocephala]
MSFRCRNFQPNNKNKYEMDPLPLIPENPVSHEVTPILRRTLQDTLNGEIYPKQIAEQFVKDVKEDEPAFKHNAKRVLEIHERAQEITAKTQLAAADIMYQNALYLIQKDKLDCSFELRERIKLERCRLFKRLEAEFVLEFNLIKSSDLLPDMIHRYLDFRNHEHTICPGCIEKIKTKDNKQRKNLQIKKNLQSDTVTIIKKPSFHVDPKCVIFHNYDISEIYKRNVKIINTSGTTQSIAIRSLPETSYFSAMIINNQRLAPGMSVVLTITFKPKIFRNIEDRVVLKNKDGEMFELILSCTRDLPKLITCIFKSNSNLLDRCDPDSNHFVEKRREALNSTIDCGSCLVSQYVLISIVLENKGNDGKFFIITEDDWFFQNVETVSTCMELFKGPFWIYPTYFEICSEEIVEVNIIFQPTKPGLQVETLYLICNNNAFQQIELVGDALEFSKSYIEIDIPPKDSVINKKKDYCVYFGNVRNGMTQTLVVLIRNKKVRLLTCEWKFTNRILEGLQNIKENWILQRNYHNEIGPLRGYRIRI